MQFVITIIFFRMNHTCLGSYFLPSWPSFTVDEAIFSILPFNDNTASAIIMNYGRVTYPMAMLSLKPLFSDQVIFRPDAVHYKNFVLPALWNFHALWYH